MSDRSIYFLLKRTIDLFIAGGVLLALIPLFLPLVVILRLTGEGEVFYSQERVGYRGRLFRLIKFATMLRNSPNIGSGTITLKNDARVLPLGKLLRKTKVNELPQILNVLKGEMSIVGPRPQTKECFSYFPETDREKVCLAKPGLTGLGSVVFRDEEEIIARSGKSFDRCFREDIQPFKQALEIWYLEHQSLLVDLKIIVLTAIAVVSPKSRLYKAWFKGLPKQSQMEYVD